MLLALLTSCTVSVPIGPTDSGFFGRDSVFVPNVGGDTGFAWFYWMGAIHAPGGAFSDGYFGIGALGAQDGNFICTDVGTLRERVVEVEPCPGCTFSFALTVEHTTPVGDFCDTLGLTADGDFDGLDVAFGWGPETYTYQGSYGEVVLDDPIYIQYGGDWFIFAYSYYGNGYTQVTDDYARFIHPYLVNYGSGGTVWLSGYYSRS